MIDECIAELVQYGIDKSLIKEEDRIYTTNILLLNLKLDSYTAPAEIKHIDTPEKLQETLDRICDYAIEHGLIEEDTVVHRDLFDTKIMNLLLDKPSRIIDEFWHRYDSSPVASTDYFYNFSKDSNYIRACRIKRDKKWVVSTEYGDLDITINLSKPEKDPRLIALAGTVKASSYPKCQLCMENEGYAGRINHPARENHRIIPVMLDNKKWGFQYSPYVYYNEHCIVFNGEHIPMKINHDSFVRLFDFIKLFPHYFVGSNADLPIVGGSILSHDHFQGGNYTFAMAKADIERSFSMKGFEDVSAGIVRWPMSVIRLNSKNPDSIIGLADKILAAWRQYTDEKAYIYAYTDKEPHNTITPIARMRHGSYELDLVLRNNITTEEHPLGLYHPWEELQHIKKENIGLIEVMGLAVLPSRLKAEMEQLEKYIVNKESVRGIPELDKHADWVEMIVDKYPDINSSNIEDILKQEIGQVFLQVLLCAGVYKRTEEGMNAFMRFIDYVNDL